MSSESMTAIKAYKKDYDYSYTLGAFPTMELIENKPEEIKSIYISSKYEGALDFNKICKEKNISIIESDKTINRIIQKNTYKGGN